MGRRRILFPPLRLHPRRRPCLGSVDGAANERRSRAGTLMDSISSKQLGPYEILARVGAGGMGEVYRARAPPLSRAVAIKIITGTNIDAERLGRFEQEAGAAGMLNHPNILAIHDIGVHDRSEERRVG